MRGVNKIIQHKKTLAIFTVFITIALLVLANFLPLAQKSSLASAQQSITKTSSTDWDQGANSNVTTSGDQVSLAANDKHSWYSTGGTWNYRKKLTIDKSKVSGADNTPITDFPVLVSLATDAELASHALDSGNDILFTSNDEKTKLSHEIESFDGNTGALIAWVKLPQVAKGNDTVIYMYYGNASSGDMRNASDVWSNSYGGVWHDIEGSGTNIADSASFHNTASIQNEASPWSASGKIGNGVQGAGSTYATVNENASLKASNITVSSWVKLSSIDNWTSIMAATSNWNYSDGFVLGTDAGGNTCFWIGVGNGNGYNVGYCGAGVSAGSWAYVTGTYDGQNVKYYVNGGYVGATPTTYPIIWPSGNYFLQRAYFHSFPRGIINGLSDEMRFSSTARSTSWVATEYANQNDPSTFISVSSEVAKTSLTIASDNISNNWYQSSSGAETDWKYRRKVTVDYTKVTADQYDFPMLVKITDGADPIFTQAQADGDDILFTNAYGDKLSHEIEKFDTTNKELDAWINAPYLSSTVNTTLYMYYGHDDAGSQQAATSVWANGYSGIWHMKDATTSTVSDSTSTGTTGNKVGVNEPIQATGKIGNAQDFDGSNDAISVNYDINKIPLTVESWVKTDRVNDGIDFVIDNDNGSYGQGIHINTQNLSVQYHDNYWDTGYDVAIGSWYHLVAVYESTSVLKIYVNGSLTNTLNYTSAALNGKSNFYISRYGNSNGYQWDGIIDEVRVTSNIRSTTWISTEYNNQNSPEAFAGVQEEQTYYPTWYNSSWKYRKSITIDRTKISAVNNTGLYAFPIMVNMASDTDLAAKSLDNGNDILFTSGDGRIKLAHEIESFDGGTGALVAWVKVPFLTPNYSAVVYMYYGNAVSSDQRNATGVWDTNFKDVAHANMPSGNLIDSTSNSNNLTADGTPTYGANGKIGSGVSMPGDIGTRFSKNSAVVSTYPFSISLWVNPSDLTGNRTLFEISETGGWQNRFLTMIASTGISLGTTNSPNFQDMTATYGISTGTWYYVTIVGVSATERHIYINGTDYATGITSVTPSGLNRTYLGVNEEGSFYWAYAGLMDEYRISSSARSADWIKTEYNNQNSPATFYSLGSEDVGASYASPTSITPGSGIIDFVWNGGWKATGSLTSSVTVPASTSIIYYGRTSAVGGSSDASWSAWTTIGTATTTGTFSVDSGAMPVANRYLQIKAALISNDGAYTTGTPVMADYTINYLADVDPPTNPSTVTANIGGNPLTSGTWTNTAGTVNFLFSGASDSDSGVAGYYPYFGTSASGESILSIAHVGAPGDNQSFSGTIASGNTYYFRIKTIDNAGNTSASATLFTIGCDTAAPANPAFISANPAGFSTTTSYTFSWPAASDTGGSGLKWYEYKRGTDLSWSHTADSSTTSVSAITPYQQGANVFYVRSVDNATNTASGYVQVTYYWSGTAPAKPNNLAVTPGTNDANSFTIDWDKPSVAGGDPPIVAYLYSINAEPTISNTVRVASIDNHITLGPSPFATQQGINTVYMVSEDQAGNKSFETAYVASTTFNCQTSAPPTPISVTISDSSNRAIDLWALTITWMPGVGYDANAFSHYQIQRSTDGFNFTDLATTTSLAYIDTQNISNQYTYTYQIREVDTAAKESAVSSTVSYQPRGNYTTPPTLLNTPGSTTTSSSATISWDTDRISTSFVRYGTTQNSLLDSKGQIDLTQSHEVILNGLSGSTLYYFQVQSTDENRDYSLESAYSTTYTFTTLAQPTVSTVRVDNITLSSADISFETTTVASSRINYGKTSSYGYSIDDSSSAAATTHQIKITSLDHSSRYHFKVTSTDVNGNLILSDDYSFETLPMPEIEGAGITEIKDQPGQMARVTWTTNVGATSIVKYKTEGIEEKESVKSKLETDHEIILNDLIDSSKYTITIESRDQFGNLAEGAPLTYQTSADKRPPTISNIIIETSNVGYDKVEKAQIIISWKTDEFSSSKVDYGTAEAGDYTSSSGEDQTLTRDHQVIISDLTPGAVVHLKVISGDRSGNIASSGDNVAITGESRKSVLQLIINIINRIFGGIIKL